MPAQKRSVSVCLEGKNSRRGLGFMVKNIFENKKGKNWKKLICVLLSASVISAGCGEKNNEDVNSGTQPTIEVTQGSKEPTKAADATEPTKAADSTQPTKEAVGDTTEPTKGASEDVAEPTKEAAAMRDMTTMEYVQSLGVGINLGNTFESCGFESTTVTGYETGWGSPAITPKILEGYAKCGFGVMRIPVAWSNLMGDDYTINEKYLKRVKSVVDCVLNNDMCVILNIHWDGGWWTGFSEPDKKDECMYKYERIWTQLTEAFGDYDDRLMFESLNEEGCWENIWNRYGGTQGKEEAYALLNEINQKFVDIVRGSGGNNALRHLLIAGYATDIELTCDELFLMPQDPAGRMAVSVHYYTPSTFAILDEDASWGKMQPDWGTEEEYEALYKNMDMMKEHFIDKGIPVIVGEFGSVTTNKVEGPVNRYLTAVCDAAYRRGLCPVLWDVTNVFYNRSAAKFIDEELLSGLMSVLEIER